MVHCKHIFLFVLTYLFLQQFRLTLVALVILLLPMNLDLDLWNQLPTLIY